MENILDTVKNFVRSFSFSGKNSPSILGIDLGASSIKVVQLKKERGVTVLETYGELALGPYAGTEVGRATKLSSSKLAEALGDILAEANTTTTLCGVSIPFSSSLISTMSFPGNIDESQLARMIPIEARKYIPVPISEVTLDWFVVPENENKYLSQENKTPGKKILGGSNAPTSITQSNQTSVLLVAIHNEILNKYKNVFDTVGLSVSFYEIEIFSTIRSIITQGIDPVLIVDIGAATTKVYVVEFGIVKVSHIINKGSQDITLAISRSLGMSVVEAEKLKREVGLMGDVDRPQLKELILLTLEYIFSESNRVLLNYQQKYSRGVGKILFTGGGSVLKGLREEATTRFSVEITDADPFAKTQTPAFLEGVLKDIGPEFAVAIGIALRKLQELG